MTVRRDWFLLLQIMYFVFLFLYSWMILFEFRPAIRPLEYIVLLWMCTFLLEELREVRQVKAAYADEIIKFLSPKHLSDETAESVRALASLVLSHCRIDHL